MSDQKISGSDHTAPITIELGGLVIHARTATAEEAADLIQFGEVLIEIGTMMLNSGSAANRQLEEEYLAEARLGVKHFTHDRDKALIDCLTIPQLCAVMERVTEPHRKPNPFLS